MSTDDFPMRAQRAARWSLAIAAACVVALYFFWDALGFLAIVLIAIPAFMLTDFDLYRMAFGDPVAVLSANATRASGAGQKSGGLSRVTLFVIMVFMLVIILGTMAEIVRSKEWMLLLPVGFAMILFAGCVHAWRRKNRRQRSPHESAGAARNP